MASQAGLSDLWRSARADAPAEEHPDPPILEEALRRACDAGRVRWPRVHVTDEAFATWLAERCPDGEDPATALASLHVADLYLACACATGDVTALARFEAEVLPAARPAIARVSPSDEEDVLSEVRVRLLVDGESGPGRIRSYLGRGPLTSWVQVVATRIAYSQLRRARRADGEREDVSRLADLPVPGDDAELSRIRAEFAAPFRDAFGEALRALTPRDRNVLRLYLLDGVSSEALGRMYGVHRATIARWIAGIHEQLLADTRRRLSRELDLDRRDFESFMRLVQSQLEVSIASALA